MDITFARRKETLKGHHFCVKEKIQKEPYVFFQEKGKIRQDLKSLIKRLHMAASYDSTTSFSDRVAH